MNVREGRVREWRVGTNRMKRRDQNGPERRIYVGAKGHRYVKPDELPRDPNVKRRLERADLLASRLGLKGKQEGRSPAD